MMAPVCRHCGSPLPAGATRYCCSGCEAVAGLLSSEGLTRYYSLSGGSGTPAAPPEAHSLAWLDPVLARALATPGELAVMEVDVQGLHCAGCVWLMDELFRREDGGVAVTVNPALGKAQLTFRRARFDVAHYLRAVERFGYRFGPSRKQAASESSDLPIRLGICAALAMNVMLFSVSFYFGLAPTDGPLFVLFTRLSVALSTAVVLIGGWPFFRAAIRGLRTGTLHLDLPIALGILLAFAASLVQARSGRGDHAYLDTLNVFVTLMLVGRWLQQRLLERNRRLLLEDDGADGILVRRVRNGVLETVPAPQVMSGDELLLAPGDVAPVEGTLLDPDGELSLAWITGESSPQRIGKGDVVPAGAIPVSGRSLRISARQDFAESRLAALLRSPSGAKHPGSALWSAVARVWVAAVLLLSAFAFWLFWPHGIARAIDVTVALLVVTCPCAIGISVPLANELALARLRRSGFYARAEVLEPLARVRQVLFDKTGTLTLGRLELERPGDAIRLGEEDRQLAFNLAARSNHPVSRCIAQVLAPHARLDPALDVREVAGNGVEIAAEGVARTGVGVAPAGNGAALTDNGAALTDNGAALASNSAVIMGNGAALTGNGAAVAGNGAALTGNGAALTASDVALADKDPALATSSVALADNGVACIGDGVALAHTRVAAAADRVAICGSAEALAANRINLARGTHRVRLGRASWATLGREPDGARGPVLAIDGVVKARFAIREALRNDAASEVRALEQSGVEVWVLSGDRTERVHALARELGIRADHARGDLSPEDKAACVAALDDRDTLYLGDGVNDRLAFEQALCAGTPAVDRPVVSGRADFFLLGEGLAPIREALNVARKLRATVRRNLALALGYNAVAIAATLSGNMTPLRAAIAMPISSVSLILLAAAGMRARRPRVERALQEARA